MQPKHTTQDPTPIIHDNKHLNQLVPNQQKKHTHKPKTACSREARAKTKCESEKNTWRIGIDRNSRDHSS